MFKKPDCLKCGLPLRIVVEGRGIGKPTIVFSCDPCKLSVIGEPPKETPKYLH